MTRNASVLLMILKRAGRELLRTEILKYAYLADLYAIRVLGKPISKFEYIRYTHGPFDSNFYPAREELLDAGLIHKESRCGPRGRPYELLHLSEPSVEPAGFTKAERFIIDHIVNKYADKSFDDLLTLVYKTSPMRRGARKNEPLPMRRERNKISDAEGGLSLETVLTSIDQLDRGDYLSLEELKTEVEGR